MTDSPPYAQQEATKLLGIAKELFHSDVSTDKGIEDRFQKEIDGIRASGTNVSQIARLMESSNGKFDTLPHVTESVGKDGYTEWLFKSSPLDVFASRSNNEIQVGLQDSTTDFQFRGPVPSGQDEPNNTTPSNRVLTYGNVASDVAHTTQFDDQSHTIKFQNTVSFPHAGGLPSPSEHPQSAKDLDLSASLLGTAAQMAFAGDSSSVNPAAIKEYLENLTPVERRALVQDMMASSQYSATDKPTKDSDYSDVKAVQLDKQKDIQSITFAHRSFGQQEQDMTITLDHKRTDEGANTKEMHLPDGTLRSVSYADDGTPNHIADSNGTFLTRTERSGEKGDTWEISTSGGLELSLQGDHPSGPMEEVKNVSFLPNGSIDIEHIPNDDPRAPIRDVLTVDAKGDTILSSTDGYGKTSSTTYHHQVVKDQNNKLLDDQYVISNPDWDPGIKQQALAFAQRYDKDLDAATTEITKMPDGQWEKFRPIVWAYLNIRK